MTDETPQKSRARTPDARSERLKSALKANLSRRKMQAKARKAGTDAAADGSATEETERD